MLPARAAGISWGCETATREQPCWPTRARVGGNLPAI